MLDCGEDKYDDHPEYGGVNWFEPYREQELEALRGFELEDKPYRIAVCHVPFMSAGEMSGQFDIIAGGFTARGMRRSSAWRPSS